MWDILRPLTQTLGRRGTRLHTRNESHCRVSDHKTAPCTQIVGSEDDPKPIARGCHIARCVVSTESVQLLSSDGVNNDETITGTVARRFHNEPLEVKVHSLKSDHSNGKGN